MKFIKLIVAALALSMTFASHAVLAADKEKVVFQVSDNDPAKWNLALNNAKNVQQSLGGVDKSEVEIVAYGPGINMLKSDSAVGNRVEEAKKAGVSVVACQNTMKGMKLTDADMLPNTSYVPAGVVELMHKQKEGYAYIRP
ncbi:MAG: DsrE family protein [Gallionellaceae bacterium]